MPWYQHSLFYKILQGRNTECHGRSMVRSDDLSIPPSSIFGSSLLDYWLLSASPTFLVTFACCSLPGEKTCVNTSLFTCTALQGSVNCEDLEIQLSISCFKRREKTALKKCAESQNVDFKAPTGKLAVSGLVNCTCFVTKFRCLWFFVIGEK